MSDDVLKSFSALASVWVWKKVSIIIFHLAQIFCIQTSFVVSQFTGEKMMLRF